VYIKEETVYKLIKPTQDQKSMGGAKDHPAGTVREKVKAG
jgi:hypothetical protein